VTDVNSREILIVVYITKGISGLSSDATSTCLWWHANKVTVIVRSKTVK